MPISPSVDIMLQFVAAFVRESAASEWILTGTKARRTGGATKAAGEVEPCADEASCRSGNAGAVVEAGCREGVTFKKSSARFTMNMVRYAA